MSPNELYGMKESWEPYPHEEHEKYVESDIPPKSKRWACVWKDRVGYRVIYASTENQHKAFRTLMEVIGNENMLVTGAPLTTAVKLFKKPVVKGLIKQGICTIKDDRLILTARRPEHKDAFIEQGLRNKEAVSKKGK